MALTDEGGSSGIPATMLVGPTGYGGNCGNGGFGCGFGGDWAWILLLLLLGGNGWGGGFGMGGGMWPMMAMGGMDGFGLYPWLNNSQHISDGFQVQQLNTQVGDLRTDVNRGFGDVQLGIAGINQSICQTGNGITAAVNNGFYGAEIAAQGRHNSLTGQLYQNEIASLNRSFAEQTANQQGFNAVAAGLADAKYVEATEACATRTAAASNTRDIIDNQTRVGQAILDKLCQLELDGIKGQLAQAQRENVGLQNQLNMATFQASQVDQTAQLRANQATVANQLVSELRSCPIPAQPVYGNQPIFTCSGPQWNNSGCGCGCNGNIA